MEQLHNNAREAKKIAMKSLRKSLSEALPLSLEEHILDNILGHLNLLEEEANESWKLETAEEEKAGLSSLYLHLSQIYRSIRSRLFSPWGPYAPVYYQLTPGLIDPLQEILAELKTEETEQEDEGGEIMGGNEEEVEDGDNDEVEKGGEGEAKEEEKGENQLEKRLEAEEEETKEEQEAEAGEIKGEKEAEN